MIKIFANVPNCTKIAEVQNFQLSKTERIKLDRENLIIDSTDNHCHVNGPHYLLHDGLDYPDSYPDNEMSEKVICEAHKNCIDKTLCGGAQPHDRCDECGNCGINEYAKCIPIKDINPLTN
jgi:hypothetical protein